MSRTTFNERFRLRRCRRRLYRSFDRASSDKPDEFNRHLAVRLIKIFGVRVKYPGRYVSLDEGVRDNSGCLFSDGRFRKRQNDSSLADTNYAKR